MSTFGDELTKFATALRAPGLPVPSGLLGPDGRPSAKRFSVYRNNVVVGLTEALQANFPAVARIVGKEFFQTMAREYVLREPPRSPILLAYGVTFPSFIDAFEPASTLPYLGDVARIETSWTAAYHAAECEPIDPTVFSSVPKEYLANLRFECHLSLQIVRSKYPALTIWRMNVHDGVPEPIDLDAGGQDCLLVRPDAAVDVRLIPDGAAEFVFALLDGETVGTAAKAGWAASINFDLAENLAGLIGAGAIVSCSLPGVALDAPSIHSELET